MKRFLITLAAAWPMSLTAGEPATVVNIDFATLPPLLNQCRDDPVIPATGIASLLIRQDLGGDVNGVHIIRRLNAHGEGTGLNSGDLYRINFNVGPAFLPTVNNITNERGMVNLVADISLVNLSNPGSGISKVHVVIVTVLDFTIGGANETRVLHTTMECIGRN